MSWQIQVHRAKPNPAGKDKSGGFPKPEQLLGEWVDLKNIGDASVSLSLLHLSHAEYDQGCRFKQNAIYWNGGTGSLSPGEILRVHTGKSADRWHMKAEDSAGATYHAFAEKGNFVLNNACGDYIAVWWKNGGDFQKDDGTGYDPNPPDGGILIRVGDKLVSGVPATSYRGW